MAEIGQHLFAALALPFVVDAAYCQQYSFRRALSDTGGEIGIVVQDTVIVLKPEIALQVAPLSVVIQIKNRFELVMVLFRHFSAYLFAQGVV